jgi:hypothetical protein
MIPSLAAESIGDHRFIDGGDFVGTTQTEGARSPPPPSVAVQKKVPSFTLKTEHGGGHGLNDQSFDLNQPRTRIDSYC